MNDFFLPASLFTHQPECALLLAAVFVGAVVFLCGYHADQRHQK